MPIVILSNDQLCASDRFVFGWVKRKGKYPINEFIRTCFVNLISYFKFPIFLKIVSYFNLTKNKFPIFFFEKI